MRNAPAESSATVLQMEQLGAIRRLVLNRPSRRNALNAALVDSLTAALTDAEDDPATRAVLITGAGPSFCAGADLRHLLEFSVAGESPVPFLRTVSNLTRRIERSPLPIVAVLHGHAVAGGLEIALACDVVLAEAGTLIGDGHIRNQLVPGAGSAVRMRRKFGDPLGRWLGLTGELLPAERFVRTGWLHEVVESGRGSDAGLRVAETLAAAGNSAQATFKLLLADLDEIPTVEAGLKLELDQFDRHWSAHDIPTELRRFLSRRTTG